MKPRMFIGSSVEGKDIAEYIQLGLEYDVETTIWHQGVFGLSDGSLEALVRAAKDFDFAALVLTPDDLVTKRGTEKGRPRDNVVFELGLFMGALGRERTFIVYNRDKKPDLPSDLAGVTSATFANHSDGNLRAAVGPVCTQIKDAIKACGLKASHAAKAEAPAPATKSEPPTVVVDAWHRGDYATITEALEAVKAGTRILVRPGVYEEGIVIDKFVEIRGDGERKDIVIEASGKATVLFQANNGRIANLTLRQAVGSKWYAVDIAQGRLELKDCDISSKDFSCVAIHSGADPHLRSNRIHDGKEAGVFVYENGQGTLEENEIVANAGAGVKITEYGKPTLRSNRIHDGKTVGVIVHTNGQGTLEGNEIFANALNGVAITNGGNPTLRRNSIFQNGYEGIWVYNGGGGIFEDNVFRDNAEGAWKIDPDCEANVRRRGNKE
jgi:parallel beta-helix repeat protein